MWLLPAFTVFAADLPDLGVIYTGRLIGYGRACAEERFVPGKTVDGLRHYDRKCIGAGTGYGKALGGLFDEARKESKKTLLLGVGDHFSLDYRARSVVVETPEGERAVGKDELLYHEPHGWVVLSDADPDRFQGIVETQAAANTVIEGDAVAQFLVDAGYDALVPGKHDFYFGAERLRQISRLLARQKRPVQMLATNLIISASLRNPPNRIPERLRDRNFVTKHADVTIETPPVVLPWLRRVNVKAKEGTFSKIVMCPVGKEGKDKACLDPSETVELKPEPGKRGYFLPKGAPQLREVTSYHVCAEGVAAKEKEPPMYCTMFDVAQPYFQYGAENSRETFPAPYFVDSERDVVVMGVVAPGLEKQVGLLNMVWLDPKNRHEIRAVAIDAIQSIEQLMDYCAAKGDCKPGRRMVLMAQMPGEAAFAVQRRTGYRFDLVIAEANQFTHTPLPGVDYPEKYPALVVSPRPIYSSRAPEALEMHAQMVQFDDKNRTFRTKTVQKNAHPIVLETGAPMASRIQTALQAMGRHPGGAADADFRLLVLEAMRSRVSASVALLQKRDLFEVSRILQRIEAGLKTEDDKMRAAVESILWKGDFLMPRLVKGSALKRALDRSKEFDSADQDVYFYEPEYNRGLHALGVFLDQESKKYVVNGSPIEDEKPYLVAMTDFLAFGDTGYPELAQEVVGSAERPADLEVQPRISELVLDRLRKPEEAKLARGKGTNFGTYMDYLEWPGFPVEPEATLIVQFKEYFQSAANGSPQFPGLVKAETKSAETLTQVRPRWRVMLERAEVAWSDYWHNQANQGALLRAFEGITESRVATPETHSLMTAWALELRREMFRTVGFVRTEGRLQSQSVENSESRFVHSYPQNEVAVEGGVRRAIGRSIYQRPWWGWLASGVVNTQPQIPLFASRVSYLTGEGRSTLAFDASLGRTTRALGKLGLRRETRDSWAEIGTFAGVVRRPSEYSVGDLAPCELRYESLSACLGNPSRVLPERVEASALRQQTVLGGGMESGLFLNVQWRVPLTPTNSAQLVLENRGRWYFNHGKDIPLDTRLSNLFSAGLSIPLAGRLALKPTWTLFHYQNKNGFVFAPGGGFARRPGVLLMGNSFDIRVEYRFDWIEGQPWLKVLRYGGGK